MPVVLVYRCSCPARKTQYSLARCGTTMLAQPCGRFLRFHKLKGCRGKTGKHKKTKINTSKPGSTSLYITSPHSIWHCPMRPLWRPPLQAARFDMPKASRQTNGRNFPWQLCSVIAGVLKLVVVMCSFLLVLLLLLLGGFGSPAIGALIVSQTLNAKNAEICPDLPLPCVLVVVAVVVVAAAAPPARGAPID